MARIIASLLLVACSAAAQPSPEVQVVSLEQASLRTSPRVVTLTPDSDQALDAATAALLRWEAAGIAPGQLQTGSDGMPARFVAACIDRPDGSCVEGATTERGIEVSRSSPRWLMVWTHEVGHAFGLSDAYARGIMSSREDCIDAQALHDACVLLMCSHLSPEECP